MLTKNVKKEFPKCEVVEENGKIVVIVPEGAKSIGYFTDFEFQRKLGFQKVVLPASLTEIEPSTFYACYDLEEIEIPGSVKKLDFQTFAHCKKLKKVVLNEGLEEISWGVFNGTPALEELNIPATVIKMGDEFRDTFNQCDLSPFEECYDNEGSGIARADIKIACPERFDDKCFKGTK